MDSSRSIIIMAFVSIPSVNLEKKMKDIQKSATELFLGYFLPNQKRMLAYILCYIPNRADAEDVFQNTASVLWKKFDQYTEGTDFIAWSTVTARFEILSYFKKKQAGRIYFDEELQGIIDAEAKSVSDQFDERVDALRECLQRLISPEIQIMKMRYEQDLPFAQIASRLGISGTAAFKKVAKIHGHLMQCIRHRAAFGEGA